MAGTTKTRATLDTNFTDNTTKAITPQLLRDFLWSVAMTWRTVNTVTATYGILVTDDAVFGNHASTPFTMTLPTAVGITGKMYRLKNINDAAVTIATTSAQTMDGYSTIVLQRGQALTLMSDGANWIQLHLPIGAGGDLVLPKQSGIGIKVDPAAPTFGWKDLLGPVQTRGTGSSVPTFAVYRGTIYQYQFSTLSTAFFEFHMPHDWVPGSDIYIHAHWSQNVGLLSSGALTWSFDASYAHGYQRGAFGAPLTVAAALTPTIKTQYEHYINEVKLATAGGTGGILDATNMEPDGVILVRANVSANTLSPAADPFLHFVDVHYQSTQMATKGRNYPFY